MAAAVDKVSGLTCSSVYACFSLYVLWTLVCVLSVTGPG